MKSREGWVVDLDRYCPEIWQDCCRIWILTYLLRRFWFILDQTLWIGRALEKASKLKLGFSKPSSFVRIVRFVEDGRVDNKGSIERARGLTDPCP